MIRAAAATLLALVACSGDDTATPDAPTDADASPWSTVQELPERRLEPGVTANGTQIVVLGGYSNTLAEGLTVTRAGLLYDTFADTWTSLEPALPVEWTHLNVSAIASSIFVVGGLDRDLAPHGDTFVLDLGARVWEAMTPMPIGEERGAAGVVTDPPFIYLFGGSTVGRTGATATNLALDTSATGAHQRGVWTTLPPLPSPRSHVAATRMGDGTFIVTGGLDELGKPIAETLSLAPNATEWTVRAPMPTPRGGCAYGMALGQLMCAGGETEAAALKIVEGYDPVTDLWTTYPKMPVARAGIHGAMVGQRMFIPGGAEALRFEPTTTMYVFTPVDTLHRDELGSN